MSQHYFITHEFNVLSNTLALTPEFKMVDCAAWKETNFCPVY